MKGKTYILSLAVSNYKETKLHLPNPIKDSDAIVRALEKYEIEDTITLHDEELDRRGIQHSLNKIKNKCNKDEDTLLVFFNGHGEVQHDTMYFLFQEARSGDRNTWYSWQSFMEDLRTLDILNIGLFINCCYSGNIFFEGKRGTNLNDDKEYTRYLLTSGRFNETVNDNSPFIKYIVQFLSENNHIQLHLSNLISNIYIRFRDSEDLGSNAKKGVFEGHNGGEITLYLKNSDEKCWKDAQEKDKLDAYEDYLNLFTDGKWRNEATERKKELENEKSSWLDTCKMCLDKIDEHEKRKIKNPKYMEDAKRFQKNFSQIIEDLGDEKSISEAWNSIKHSKNIQDFRDFIGNEKYKKSYFAKIAERTICVLEERQLEEKLWQKACNIKSKKPKERYTAYAEYIRRCPNGKRLGEVNKNMDEIIDFMAIEEETQLPKREILLKNLKEKYDTLYYVQGFYKNEVNKFIQKISYENNKIKLDTELNKAIKEGNIEAINSILEHIRGCTKDEGKNYNMLQIRAEDALKDYNIRAKNTFDDIQKQEENASYPYLLYSFKNEFLNHELAKQAAKILFEKDQQVFDNAEQEKELVTYENYYNLFKSCEGYSLEKAASRISEIKYFNNLKTKQEFLLYIDEYKNKDGIRIAAANEAIKKIEKQERKDALFLEIKKNRTIELCYIYLDEYKDDDEYRRVVVEILHEEENIKNDNNDFQNIINQTDLNSKLNACNLYLIEEKYTLHKEEVKAIKIEVEKEIKELSDFDEALKSKQRIKLEEFKELYPNSLKIPDANDYLAFWEAKELEDVTLLKQYLYNFSLNADEAQECLDFFNAKASRDILALERHSKPNSIFKERAIALIKELKSYENSHKLFLLAKEKDDIVYYEDYIYSTYLKDKEEENFVRKRFEELKLEKAEAAAFKVAVTEDNILKYITTYGKEGKYYSEVIERLSNIRLGVTSKDKKISEQIENTTSIVSELLANIKNSNEAIETLYKTVNDTNEVNNNFLKNLSNDVYNHSQNSNKYIESLSNSVNSNNQTYAELLKNLSNNSQTNNNSILNLSKSINKLIYLFLIATIVTISIIAYHYFLQK